METNIGLIKMTVERTNVSSFYMRIHESKYTLFLKVKQSLEKL